MSSWRGSNGLKMSGKKKKEFNPTKDILVDLTLSDENFNVFDRMVKVPFKKALPRLEEILYGKLGFKKKK